jgi:hypothetical protein
MRHSIVVPLALMLLRSNPLNKHGNPVIAVAKRKTPIPIFVGRSDV